MLDGSTAEVFVRMLPERYLLDQFLTVMESGARTIDLCTYLASKNPDESEEARKASAYPEIPPPTGYSPVPAGWADNLTDESTAELYQVAKDLNFMRAANLAEGRLAAKKQLAPLNQRLLMQIFPLALKMAQGLASGSLDSTPSTPPSPAAVETKS